MRPSLLREPAGVEGAGVSLRAHNSQLKLRSLNICGGLCCERVAHTHTHD